MPEFANVGMIVKNGFRKSRVYKTKFARDAESEKMIDYIVDHRVFDWVDVIWVGEIRDGLLNDMFTKKNNTLVSLNEKLANIFDKKRDGMVEAFSALGD